MGKFVDRAKQAISGVKEVVTKIDLKKDEVIIELSEKITKLEAIVAKLSKVLEKLQDKKADKKSEAKKEENKKAE